MPISPEKAKNYPGGSIHSKKWKAFRAFILFRAANRCEGTPQHPDCRAHNALPHPETGGKVVLTIAHMDHDESHADPERCRALCQRCHNKWDAPHRQENAAITRRRKSAQIDIEDYLEVKHYYSGDSALQDICIDPTPPKSDGPAPIHMIARLPSEECGCPEELWQIDGLHLLFHFEEDGSSDAFIFAGDWETETNLEAKSLDDLRAKSFQWLADVMDGIATEVSR